MFIDTFESALEGLVLESGRLMCSTKVGGWKELTLGKREKR